MTMAGATMYRRRRIVATAAAMAVAVVTVAAVTVAAVMKLGATGVAATVVVAMTVAGAAMPRRRMIVATAAAMAAAVTVAAVTVLVGLRSQDLHRKNCLVRRIHGRFLTLYLIPHRCLQKYRAPQRMHRPRNGPFQPRVLRCRGLPAKSS